MITALEYFSHGGRDLRAAGCVPPAHLINAGVFLNKVNLLLAAFDAARGSHFAAIVNSGYRTKAINACIPNAAPSSKHMSGNAVDLRDAGGELKKWLVTAKGKGTLNVCGLFMEHPSATPTWCHLQDIAPGSGNLIFYP
jgi:Peptidase M15